MSKDQTHGIHGGKSYSRREAPCAKSQPKMVRRLKARVDDYAKSMDMVAHNQFPASITFTKPGSQRRARVDR